MFRLAAGARLLVKVTGHQDGDLFPTGPGENADQVSGELAGSLRERTALMATTAHGASTETHQRCQRERPSTSIPGLLSLCHARIPQV